MHSDRKERKKRKREYEKKIKRYYQKGPQKGEEKKPSPRDENLLSEEYFEQLELFHTIRPHSFGMASNIRNFEQWIDMYEIKTFIDYGCGKGCLVNTINDLYPNSCIGYDPGLKKWREVPKEKKEMLICTDVLEHIEPDYIINVLKHMDSLFTKVAYLLIATSAAKKSLPDGRNAHLIQKKPEWWKQTLLENINAKIVYEEYKIQNTKKRTKIIGDEKVTIKSIPNNKYIVVLEKNNE
jgi:hypothetical protein